MDMFKLILALLCMGGLKAMEPEKAISSMPMKQEQEIAPNQRLLIQNNYVDKILVRYVCSDSSNQLEMIVIPGECKPLKGEVHSIIDVRFEAHGDYKKYLNFATSPNYRISINDLLLKEKNDDIVLIIGDSKNTAGAPEVRRTKAAYESPSIMGFLKGCSNAVISKTGEYASYYGQPMISRVSSFKS